MQLYIVRHGIAIDREDPKCPPDPERYLTEEGIEKTKQVAKGVAALGVTADLFLTSPYVRASQTAEIFAGAGLRQAKNPANGFAVAGRRAFAVVSGACKGEAGVFGFSLWTCSATRRRSRYGARGEEAPDRIEKSGCGVCGIETALAADWRACLAGDSQVAAARREIDRRTSLVGSQDGKLRSGPGG